ncbi:ABC-2 transporter permease [Cohnella fermenti]|uniref:ABC-2 transporter permease n=1 Tax=Cohnella fermenti TaxID=2565925 RepID=A0A4S4C2D5_9BACL|nr:ABC-2 transporter permease [Cohnella fermenti]THF81679.1 ABC-2 transporter permease [Cohnella fermenti]
MVNLIRKDIIALKWYWLFVLGYGAVFGLIARSPHSPLIIVMLPAIMLTIFVSNIELRNKSMLFIGSLPVKRSQIVRAKYASTFLYLTIGIAMALLMQLISRSFPDEVFTLNGFVLAIGTAVALLYSSVYYPLHYLLGPRNSSIISVIMIFLSSALAASLNKSIDLSRIALPSKLQVLIGLPLAGLVLLYVSYRVSLAILSRRDIEG